VEFYQLSIEPPEVLTAENVSAGGLRIILSFIITHSQYRMGDMKKCVICKKSLRGRQRRFCSRSCKNLDTNNRHQSYIAQQRRGRDRKIELIELKGARCEYCGYSRNYAALQLHHPNPAEKDFQLDIRSLSNRRWAVVLEEAKKCILLCANCHAEEHYPNCTL